MRDDWRQVLRETRAYRPEQIEEMALARRRRQLLGNSGRLLIVAADHPARGAMSIGDDPLAMSDRYELLDRLMVALDNPGVDGVLGTPDVIDDLLLLGALEDKVVIGSMNRGGLPGSVFEFDDRFTAYTPAAIAAANLDGGKMLLRIDPQDPATIRTIEQAARAIGRLADHRLMAMVEPFMSSRTEGRACNELTADAVIRSMAISSGLGKTSAYTWLKVPIVPDMDRVVEASTLPLVLLGGELGTDRDSVYTAWERAVSLPGVRGLVVGRNLLYPPDGNVADAVATAVGIL